MKPLLIIPPAPARWPAMQALPLHDDPLWQDDLEKRFAVGVPRSQDAFVVFADGGLMLGCAGISKRHDLGVLSRVFVRPEHRGRGLARQLIETALSWFDMTGGKWLYATAPADVGEALGARFGFRPIRRATQQDSPRVVLLRRAADAPEDPLTTADAGVTVHAITRANWPTLVVLMHNRPGPDPRIPLDDSAVAAEQAALQLVAELEAGECHLLGAFRGPRLIAAASVATGAAGERTYAMIMPHDDIPPALREAVIQFARGRGFAKVDFPLEHLGSAAAEGPPSES